MRIPPSVLPLLFTTLLLHLHPISTLTIHPPAASPTATSPSTAPTANSKTTEYIHTSCQTTQYPELCYTSLSIYANAVHQNPARLARAAIGVSLYRARYTAVYFNNLARQAEYGADHRVIAALHDCFSVFGDAVDQIRDSLRQMKSIGRGGGGETFRFEMSNVQTWMSAALTNEETCTDGFEDLGDGEMRMEVSDHVKKAEEVTSNALALVNSYVATAYAP